MTTTEPVFLKNWPDYLEFKALRSHTVMAWCGVFIFPAFVFLDYLVVEQWKLFFMVRLCAASAIALMLLLQPRLHLRSETIAHVSSQLVFISLIWMLIQVNTTQQFFIYALNSCTAFVASAIFLLWSPKNSIFLALSTVVIFLVLSSGFSPLTFTEIISYGSLVLLTIVIMTQLYVHFHYTMVYRDFKNQLQLNFVNYELNQKNHEISVQNEEILEQKEKLEELNELKDRLFMIVSHDFRSPLQSLKGLIMLINDSQNLSAENLRMITKGIKENVDYTYDFLEGLLIWSKSQMRGFEVIWRSVNIKTMVDENVCLLQGAYVAKGITLINEVNPHHFVRADKDMVRLIIRNLLSNAIKFTNPQGNVICRSTFEEGKVMVSIIDDGIGLDPEQLDSLFRFNTKTNRNGTLKERGTGLGLMLCKEFVEKNGGQIWATSAVDKGSRFNFSLEAASVEIMSVTH